MLILLLHLVLGPLLCGVLSIAFVTIAYGADSYMFEWEGLVIILQVTYIIGTLPALIVGTYVAWKSQRMLSYQRLGFLILAISMVLALLFTMLQARLHIDLSRKIGNEDQTFANAFSALLWPDFPIQFIAIAIAASFASVLCLKLAQRFKLVVSNPSTLNVSV